MASEWTNEAFERAKGLWVKRESASQIAAMMFSEFQIRVSRNAVIGKMHRAGLALGKKIAVEKPTPRPPRTRTPRISQPKPPTYPQIEAPDPKRPVCVSVTLIQLTETTCRYPVGLNPMDMHYCGMTEAENPDKPYCKYHHKIAYAGLPERRRDRAPMKTLQNF